MRSAAFPNPSMPTNSLEEPAIFGLERSMTQFTTSLRMARSSRPRTNLPNAWRTSQHEALSFEFFTNFSDLFVRGAACLRRELSAEGGRHLVIELQQAPVLFCANQ